MEIRNAKFEDISLEGFYESTCFISTLHCIRLSKPTLRLYEVEADTHHYLSELPHNSD